MSSTPRLTCPTALPICWLSSARAWARAATCRWRLATRSRGPRCGSEASAGAEHYRYLKRFTAPDDRQRDLVAGAVIFLKVDQHVAAAVDGLTPDGGDDVAPGEDVAAALPADPRCPQAGPVRRAVRLDLGDEQTATCLVARCDFRAQLHNRQTEVGVRVAAIRNQLRHDPRDRVGGHGEADADRAAARRVDRGVDADHLPGGVQKRPARVA